MKPNPQQLKKLERLAKVLDNGDVELLTQLNELETKTEAELQEIYKIALQAKASAEETQKMQGEPGYTPVKGVDYFDGEDGVPGKNYILTDTDRKKIAESIKVPVVEKVIEKTVVKETPIVTNEIVKETVEVAVLDDATVAYLEEEIKNLEERVRRVGNRGSMLGLDAINRAIDKKVYVSDTAPDDPRLNDVWIDTNAYTYRAVTGTYTIVSTDYLLDCSGTFTITLPTAVSFTGEYIIKNTGTGIITVDGNGSQTIDGVTTFALIEDEVITLRSAGTNWLII